MYSGEYPLHNTVDIINNISLNNDIPCLAYVHVYNNVGKRFLFCLDSGASNSYIKASVAKQFNAQVNMNQATTFKTADDATATSLGTAGILLDLKVCSFEVQFNVIQNCSLDALIGFDVLKNFICNFPQQSLVHVEGWRIPIVVEPLYVSSTDCKY